MFLVNVPLNVSFLSGPAGRGGRRDARGPRGSLGRRAALADPEPQGGPEAGEHRRQRAGRLGLLVKASPCFHTTNVGERDCLLLRADPRPTGDQDQGGSRRAASRPRARRRGCAPPPPPPARLRGTALCAHFTGAAERAPPDATSWFCAQLSSPSSSGSKSTWRVRRARRLTRPALPHAFSLPLPGAPAAV